MMYRIKREDRLADREERLQANVDGWSFPPGSGAGMRPEVMPFLVAYGEFAYLCPEQFHLGGAAATRELAALAHLRPGQRVLDVACFLGGPARYLAREYGCRVTGLDISRATVEGARKLTVAAGCSDMVDFVVGDAGALPFPAASFEVVWGQDSWPHQAGIIPEAARVLVPGGTLACTNSVRGPVPPAGAKAGYAAFSAGEYAQSLTDAGLRIVVREDITAYALACWESLLAALEAEMVYYSRLLGGRYGAEHGKLEQIIRDYREGRLGQVRLVAVKPE